MADNYKKLMLTFLVVFLSLAGIAQLKDTLINLYFVSNEYKANRAELEKLESVLSRIACIRQVTGYTDRVGTDQYNMELSRKRAFYIADMLDTLDIPCRKIAYKGKDPMPEAPLWKNRRVEIVASLRSVAMVKTEPSSSIVTTLNLDNIYFVPDMARITDESLQYLENLVRLLKTNYKKEHFVIIGHVNYQSKKDSTQLSDLYMLSERRAKAVYEYLAEKGISPERMQYKGLGNSQPIFVNPENEAQKKMNMRVQVIVIR